MKKTLLIILFAPLVAFCQVNDTISIISFSGSIAQPIGVQFVSMSQINKHGQHWGIFGNLKFAINSDARKAGSNFTRNMGAVINAMYTTEDPFNNTGRLGSGAPVSLQVGGMFELFDNIYLSAGLGFVETVEYAQYSSRDLGGLFYYKTQSHLDLMSSISVATIIQEKYFLQLGIDLFPVDYDHQELNKDNALERFFTESKPSNISFSIGRSFY